MKEKFSNQSVPEEGDQQETGLNGGENEEENLLSCCASKKNDFAKLCRNKLENVSKPGKILFYYFIRKY